MSTPKPTAAVKAAEPVAEVAPIIVEPMPAPVDPSADLTSATDIGDHDPIPRRAPEPESLEPPSVEAPEPTRAVGDPAPKAPADTIVIEKLRLRQWFWGFVGALIGVMLMGAVVVPFFQGGQMVIGIVAGIVVVVALAWLGMRIAGRSAPP